MQDVGVAGVLNAVLHGDTCRSITPAHDGSGIVTADIDIGAIEWQDPEEVEELFDNKLVNVYPNPGKDVLNITAPAQTDWVEVYDLNGHKVFDGKLFGNQIAVNTENWPSGMYFWKIGSTGSTTLMETGKWIKE